MYNLLAIEGIPRLTVEKALLHSTPLFPVVVNFLIHLRRDNGFSVYAVKGYSSVLNSVLTLSGRDLASSHEITMLLRSFSRYGVLSSYVPLPGASLWFFRA